MLAAYSMLSIIVTSQRASDSLYWAGVIGLKYLKVEQEEPHCSNGRRSSRSNSSVWTVSRW